MAESGKSTFLTLPPEIREQIYTEILHPNNNRLVRRDEYADYDYRDALVLYHLNQQIYYESRKIFRDLNVFVRIETPWSEAEYHVAIEGHVPILMKSQQAARFTGHSLQVKIEAPSVALPEGERPNYFVILLDDLPAFTKTWFYSNLSNPGLNQFLALSLQLRDPYAPDWEEKHVPRQVQRRLLLPFGEVKSLRQFNVNGDPKPQPSILNELNAEQAIPPATAEQALSESIKFKSEGNEALTAGNYGLALARYNKAWEAMHIIVKGRQRHVHAEAFFARELDEPFKGKNGQVERLKIRVQLVANTCLAYLKLKNWDELLYWGMRTINLMRQATGANDREIPPEDEALQTFPSATQVGKIYYRTAVAFKEMGDKAEARRLLRVAQIYLPHDETVKKELAGCALRLG